MIFVYYFELLNSLTRSIVFHLAVNVAGETEGEPIEEVQETCETCSNIVFQIYRCDDCLCALRLNESELSFSVGVV